MGEFFENLFNNEIVDTIFGLVLIFGFGIYMYGMNWAIFINNLIPGRKWSSMIPLLGGLLIAVGILLIGGGWWALAGLTDPGVWVIVYSLVSEYIIGRNKQGKNIDKEETNENEQHH